MNQELIEKLIEANFPFSKREGIYAIGEPKEIDIMPTLSELIEACDIRFEYLKKNVWAREPMFEASSGKHKCTGETPEEAVANLWLELNK